MTEENNNREEEKVEVRETTEAPKTTKAKVTETTPSNDKEERSKKRRARRSSGKVTNYSEADDKLRAEMDALIDEIDQSPDSYDAINNYGHAPIKKLGEVATKMIDVQKEFDSQVNVMTSTMEKMTDTFKEMDVESLGEAAKELYNGISSAAGKGVMKGASLIGRFTDAITGAKAKRDAEETQRNENQRLMEEMQNELPEMRKKILDLVKDFEGVDKALGRVMEEAMSLGKERIVATQEIAKYLGAGEEIQRRYAEEYITEAQEAFDETGDAEDEDYLQTVIKRQENFNNHLLVLEGSRANGVIAANQLRQIIGVIEDQRNKIKNILHNTQNEWIAQLATAGIIGSSAKAAQMLKEADNLGDKIHDNTEKMLDEAHRMTIESKGRGAVDPTKLIEATQKMQKRLEEEREAAVESAKRLEDTRAQLRGAADKLIESADRTARALEESATSQTSNDNSSSEEPKVRKPRQPRVQRPRGKGSR